MNNITPKNIYLSLLALVLSIYSYAGIPGGGPPPPTPPPPPGFPIDGGLILLFLIALIYGLYKMKKVVVETKQKTP
jgi:hypothetical protein